MRKRYALLLTAMIACMPLHAHARKDAQWNFASAQLPGQWEVSNGIELTPTVNGLHVYATSEGRIIRRSDVPFGFDTVELTYRSAHPSELRLLGNGRGKDEQWMLQAPFVINATEQPASVAISVSSYEEWNPHSPKIGLAFPAGSDFLLEKMVFQRHSLFENIAEAVKSFWTFDDFSGTTVNFLWGPQLAFTPAARAQMFRHLRPQAVSGMTGMYWIFIVIILISAMRRLVRTGTFKPRKKTVLVTLALLWVLLDVRMGSELIGYARTDIETYHSRPIGNRNLRVRDSFNDFAQRILPHLQQEESYVFLPRMERPYIHVLRYMSYPSLPITDIEQADGVLHWVVLDRSDVSVNGDGRLTINDIPVSPPGTVLIRQGQYSFLFRTES